MRVFLLMTTLLGCSLRTAAGSQPRTLVCDFDGNNATKVYTVVTAQGVGAVAGALALPPLAERFGRRRVLLTDLGLVLPVCILLYAMAPNIVLAILALVAVGAAYIGVLSGLITVVQLRAPEVLRARILSLFMVALGVVYPLGAILQGKLGDLVSLRVVTATAALLYAAFVALFLGRRADRRLSLDEPTDRISVMPASVPGSVA